MKESKSKWFNLRFKDENLNEDKEAAEWLKKLEAATWKAIKESGVDPAREYIDSVIIGGSNG